MIKFIKSTILAIALVLLLPSSAYAVGTASLTLSPNSGSYALNSTIAVTIYENSGTDAVNVVEADLSFNQATLQLAGISCNSGVFEINAPGAATGITCATVTPKTGSRAVATANFMVVGSGSAAVNFAGSSHIYRSTDNADIWNGSTSGGSYTLVAPTPTLTPVATPTPSSTAGGSGTNNSHRGNSTVTSTPTPTPTPTLSPTSKPTPTPTPAKSHTVYQQHKRGWHLFGAILGDGSSNSTGASLGISLMVVATGGLAIIATRRRLWAAWFKKVKAIYVSLFSRQSPVKSDLSLVKNKAKLQADTFFVGLKTVPKKIIRISRQKNN